MIFDTVLQVATRTSSPAARRSPATPIAIGSIAGDAVACCTPVRSDALDEQNAATLAQSFAALSDPVRLRLLSFIASAEGEVCACDLVEPSGRSQPTVSHHMKVLVDAGLVERDKRGLWVWYRAVPSRLDALRNVLG